MKAPAFQFYVRDWLTDSQLQSATESTRGIWINALCLMWLEPAQGTLTRPIGEMSKILFTSPRVFARFMADAERLKFCDISVTMSHDVTNGHKIVTLVNRRMSREYKVRQGDALRQRQSRQSRQGHAVSPEDVTAPSASASSFASASASSKPKGFIPETPRQGTTQHIGDVIGSLNLADVAKRNSDRAKTLHGDGQ